MNTSFDTRGQQDTLWRDRTAVETPYQPVTTQDDGYDRPRLGVRVDAQRLWAGGAASALVASLVAMVGVLVGRWLFHLSVLAPAQDGTYGGAHTTALIVVAFVAALAATGLVHLLMVSTARPQMFFGWIVGLVTVIAAIFPFSTTAALDAKIATGLVNLAIGAVIGILVSGVAARSSR
jgi:fatty acid desaturase